MNKFYKEGSPPFEKMYVNIIIYKFFESIKKIIQLLYNSYTAILTSF